MVFDAERAVREAVLLAAGAADLAADRVGGVLARGRALLGRADTAQLAEDGRDELRARGRLVLDRFAVPPPYLEVVARNRAAAHAGGAGAGDAGAEAGRTAARHEGHRER